MVGRKREMGRMCKIEGTKEEGREWVPKWENRKKSGTFSIDQLGVFKSGKEHKQQKIARKGEKQI